MVPLAAAGLAPIRLPAASWIPAFAGMTRGFLRLIAEFLSTLG
jgi:hypothetical protein